MGENVLERMARIDADKKIADFMAKEKMPYDFKRKYAAIRAREFMEECERRGLDYHVSVGGLDSIVLFLFLHSIGICPPGISVSYLEDQSIQRVHTALGIQKLQSAVREVKPDGTVIRWAKPQIIQEFGFPVLSKEIAAKIELLQNPTEKNKTVRHAIITGETGEYGGYQTDSRMRLSQVWLEKFGGADAEGAALVAAHLIEYYGNGQPISLDEPMHTATAHDREALTTAILQPFHAGGYHGKGNSPELPVNTITGSGSQSLITAHVVKFKGNDLGQSPTAPLQTITAGGGEFAAAGCQIVQYEDGADLGHWPKVRALLNQYCGYALKENEILLIWIRGAWRYIRDILMRMLTPRELFSAQGFPADYIIDRDYTGHEYPKCEQVARVGNSVSPPMAEALVRANLPEMCGKRFNTLRELQEAMAV